MSCESGNLKERLWPCRVFYLQSLGLEFLQQLSYLSRWDSNGITESEVLWKGWKKMASVSSLLITQKVMGPSGMCCWIFIALATQPPNPRTWSDSGIEVSTQKKPFKRTEGLAVSLSCGVVMCPNSCPSKAQIFGPRSSFAIWSSAAVRALPWRLVPQSCQLYNFFQLQREWRWSHAMVICLDMGTWRPITL